MDIRFIRFDPENNLRILFIYNNHVNVFAKSRHSLSCRFFCPQLTAIIDVTGNLYTLFLCLLTGFFTDLQYIFGKGGGDTGKMEPLRTAKDTLPIKILFLCFGNGGMCSVISTDTGALGSALLIKIDAYSVTSAYNLRGIHPVSSKRVDCRLSDHMCRKLRNIGNIHSEICKRNRYIRFRSAKAELHSFRLNKTLIIIGLQTQHDFSKTDYL